jgi:hypothetical protein
MSEVGCGPWPEYGNVARSGTSWDRQHQSPAPRTNPADLIDLSSGRGTFESHAVTYHAWNAMKYLRRSVISDWI